MSQEIESDVANGVEQYSSLCEVVTVSPAQPFAGTVLLGRARINRTG